MFVPWCMACSTSPFHVAHIDYIEGHGGSLGGKQGADGLRLWFLLRTLFAEWGLPTKILRLMVRKSPCGEGCQGGWQHAVSAKRTWSYHQQKVKTSFNRTTLTTIGLRWKSWKFLPFSVRLLSRLHRLQQIDRNQHLRPLGDAHPQALDWLAFAIWCWEPWVSCETCGMRNFSDQLVESLKIWYHLHRKQLALVRWLFRASERPKLFLS